MANHEILYSYQDLVESLEQSQRYGFLSPQPIENQIKHSIEFLSLLPKNISRALDLGSGGGLPSLVWLHLDQDINIVALDAMTKRTDFLIEVANNHKGLSNRLQVVNGRAEVLSHDSNYREMFDAVVARGFGSPAITAECGSGYLKTGGHLFVSGRPEDEIARWNVELLERLGLEFEEVMEQGHAHVAKMIKTEILSSIFPRNSKALKKQPLW